MALLAFGLAVTLYNAGELTAEVDGEAMPGLTAELYSYLDDGENYVKFSRLDCVPFTSNFRPSKRAEPEFEVKYFEQSAEVSVLSCRGFSWLSGAYILLGLLALLPLISNLAFKWVRSGFKSE
ncbi:hypothetical protein [Sphingomonas sp.]|uniref:hypothetical protein n=1 Tax=Sphingomonas sp. TaxID=28214 RepID=UPI00307F8C24